MKDVFGVINIPDDFRSKDHYIRVFQLFLRTRFSSFDNLFQDYIFCFVLFFFLLRKS